MQYTINTLPRAYPRPKEAAKNIAEHVAFDKVGRLSLVYRMRLFVDCGDCRARLRLSECM